MKELFFGIIVVFLIDSCSMQASQKENTLDLEGTTWNCEIAEGCINIYEFKSDSTFVFLSCEMQDQYFGDFYFKDGFLMLEEKGSVYSESLPESSVHRVEKKLYKVEVNGSEFWHLSFSTWENGDWIESEFKFDKSFVYYKMK